MAAVALIVPVTDVARQLGLPQPLGEDDRWLIERAIGDAQSDLEAYLGRAATPQTYTETGLIEYTNGWRLQNAPVLSVTSATPENDTSGQPTGLYTVVYVAGLDGAADPELEPLRRFVRTHAIYSTDVQALFRRVAPERARLVEQSSVEGQSVTYADTYAVTGEPGSGSPGALPTLASCDRWRIAGRRVFQRPTPYVEPWPWEYHDWRWREWW